MRGPVVGTGSGTATVVGVGSEPPEGITASTGTARTGVASAVGVVVDVGRTEVELGRVVDLDVTGKCAAIGTLLGAPRPIPAVDNSVCGIAVESTATPLKVAASSTATSRARPRDDSGRPIRDGMSQILSPACHPNVTGGRPLESD
jgi:hypothetical protein